MAANKKSYQKNGKIIGPSIGHLLQLDLMVKKECGSGTQNLELQV
jgi:hypothetical protein